MRNETKHKMMPLLSPFTTCMRAVTFVLPDEMTNVSIAGLQWFILILDLTTRGLTGQLILIPYPIYTEKKI